MTSTETIIFYIATILLSVFFAAFAQRKFRLVDGFRCSFYKSWFYCAFFLLWFVISFTDIGTDRNEYIRIFNYTSWNNLFYCEFGLNIVTSFLKMLCAGNVDVVIFFLMTISMVVYFYSIFLLRNYISVPLAVFSFCTLQYLRFYLISMYLAMAFINLSVAYVILGRKQKALFFYFVSCTFHYATLLLFPVVVYMIIRKRIRRINTLSFILIGIAYVFTLAFFVAIYEFAINSIPIFNAYKIYKLVDYGGSGLMNYLLHIPLLLFSVSYRRCEKSELSDFLLISELTAFFFSIIGYKLAVISRMNYFFYSIYILLFPAVIWSLNGGYVIFKNQKISTYGLFWMVFVLCLSLICMCDSLQTNSGLLLWSFFSPF